MCVQVTGTQYTLLALNKYTEYALRVEANGKHGPGARGDTLTVRTLSDVPSAAPQDVTAVATRCGHVLNTVCMLIIQHHRNTGPMATATAEHYQW